MRRPPQNFNYYSFLIRVCSLSGVSVDRQEVARDRETAAQHSCTVRRSTCLFFFFNSGDRQFWPAVAAFSLPSFDDEFAMKWPTKQPAVSVHWTNCSPLLQNKQLRLWRNPQAIRVILSPPQRSCLQALVLKQTLHRPRAPSSGDVSWRRATISASRWQMRRPLKLHLYNSARQCLSDEDNFFTQRVTLSLIESSLSLNGKRKRRTKPASGSSSCHGSMPIHGSSIPRGTMAATFLRACSFRLLTDVDPSMSVRSPSLQLCLTYLSDTLAERTTEGFSGQAHGIPGKVRTRPAQCSKATTYKIAMQGLCIVSTSRSVMYYAMGSYVLCDGVSSRSVHCCQEQWRLFIFISRESKWGTLQSAGNPRCAVPAEIHSICTDRPRPGPAAGLQLSPTSDTSQSVAILKGKFGGKWISHMC